MTFVSYAQNFEDVLLHRALRDIGPGFYIDVGAAHPDTDSVTRAFYDRGWNGINVEPTADFARRLQAARPRDVTLQVALGAAPGELPFYAIPGTGLSTLDRDAAQDCARQGFAFTESTVRVETLAEICRRHAAPDIHFLKIDVEGAEPAVLAGADFDTFRPWIVLVEATRPMSTEETHAAWEPMLHRAGYRFVWFDGLNRFYVAAERHAELVRHFRTPPNVFDDFLRVADSEWTRRIETAEATSAALRERALAAEEWAAAAEARAAALSASLQGSHAVMLRHQASALEAMQASKQAALTVEWARSGRAEAMVEGMLRSTSWRITGPLRQVSSLARRRLGRPVHAEAPHGQAAAPDTPQAMPDSPTPLPMPAPAVPPLPAARTSRAIRKVHQFHAGSSLGDAITNGMLMTRGILRGLGYESEIFVLQREPKLASELRLLDEMPDHADQAVIVHHSLGHDGMARLLSLPAPKILLYHNITPPELLASDPGLAALAEQGRRQLLELRPHVAATLAVSHYNAIELRALGFDPVQVCTLLFDVDALRGKAMQRPPLPAPCFTILFVGRVLPSKAQHDLIEAYIQFRQDFAGPSRLVIIGRLDLAPAYVEAMSLRAAEAGVADQVLILGHVKDAELDGWYAAADLYVSLSRHEGFGVPLIEAAARGLPVLALASGGIPYTLDDAAGLLADAAPATVAARMLRLAQDPAALGALRQGQRKAADRFRLDRQIPTLVQALTLAGVAPPAEAETRHVLERHLRITVTGHASGSYSLASVNRTLATTLDAAWPGRVRLTPIEGHAPAPLREVPQGAAEAEALARRPGFLTGPHVAISNHYPVHVPTEPADLNLALFYWEESLIAPATIETLNAGFGGVLAPTRTVARALVDSGLRVPVRVLGQALDLAPFRALRAARVSRAPGMPFSFLHISSCFPRKGVDVLLAAYARAFRAGDAVRLVIKGFPNPHNDVAQQIAALRARDTGLPDIELIDRDLGADELLALYRAADAMVLPTRGEGFNMGAAEAMAAGLPLIVTGAGGHMDFVGPETARLLAWRHAAARTHLAIPNSLWFEPDEDDLVAALGEAVAARRAAMATQTERAAAAIDAFTDGAALADRLSGAALDLLLLPPPRPVRIALVTSWGVRCGVAEYSRHLAASLADPERLAGLVVLADGRPRMPAEPGAPSAHTAWSLGDDDPMTRLEGALVHQDADVVMVQHQPGLFGWKALGRLLRLPALARRVVTVTLHTVEQLVEVADANRAEAVAALATADRVICHTMSDLERLRQLGLADNAVLIPQGTQAPDPAPALRDLAEGDAPRIGCYGFFLPGKGIPELIQAAGLLRARWPGLTLRLVNAEYDAQESRAEIARARVVAAGCGMADAIEWHTDFLRESESRALLVGCDMVAIATQESREGSSASLRSALAAGSPVMVTPLRFFEEAGDAVARFPGIDPAALAEGLAAFIGDLAARRRVQSQAREWLIERGWGVVGARTLGMVLGLFAQRRLRQAGPGRKISIQ